MDWATAEWTTGDYDAESHFYPGARTLLELLKAKREQNVFYRNNADGTFTDATAAAGLAGHGWGGDCAVFDYDGDGIVDLFVSNMFGASQLFRNDGHARFTDTTREALGRIAFGAVGTRAFDFDLDGRLDLFVSDMHSDMWVLPDIDPSVLDVHAEYTKFMGPMIDLGLVPESMERQYALAAWIDYKSVLFGNALHRNLGGGRFEEVSDRARSETFQTWGVAPADFRNAGMEDVFLPAGMGFPYFVWDNRYLQNNGDGTFAENAAAAGLAPAPGGPFLDLVIRGKRAPKSSRSAATADFDGDGRVDLVVNNFNGRAYLYMNRSPVRTWIEFRLTGTRSNRDAIGALVTIEAGARTQVRQVQAAGGYLAQSSKTLHFGLAGGNEVTACEIRWPSGHVQRIEKPAAGRLHEVTEPPQ